MSWWVVSANGTASGPHSELEARSDHTRMVGKLVAGMGDIGSVWIVRANSKEEALKSEKPR